MSVNSSLNSAQQKVADFILLSGTIIVLLIGAGVLTSIWSEWASKPKPQTIAQVIAQQDDPSNAANPTDTVTVKGTVIKRVVNDSSFRGRCNLTITDGQQNSLLIMSPKCFPAGSMIQATGVLNPIGLTVTSSKDISYLSNSDIVTQSAANAGTSLYVTIYDKYKIGKAIEAGLPVKFPNWKILNSRKITLNDYDFEGLKVYSKQNDNTLEDCARSHGALTAVYQREKNYFVITGCA